MLFSFIFIGSFFFSTLFSYGFFWVYLVQFTQYFSSPYGLHSDSTQGQDFSSTLLQPSQSLVRSEDSTLKKHKGLAIIQHKQIFELFAVLPLSESLLCKCYWYDCHKTNHMFLWGRQENIFLALLQQSGKLEHRDVKALVLGSPVSPNVSRGAEDWGFQMFREDLPSEQGGWLALHR